MTETILHGSKRVSRLHLENVLLKVMLIFLIRLLIKKNYTLELQLLATAILHLEISSATITPTPSLSSAAGSLHRETPSLTSFQSTITNEYLARTLNASVTQSQGTKVTSSQTANFQINMPVTNTKLAHLQGKGKLICC